MSLFILPNRPQFMSLADADAWLRAWHERRYGTANPDLLPTYRKLGEEMTELGDALKRINLHDGTGRALEEMADVVLVMFHLARAVGGQLSVALLKKMAVINQRLTDPAAGRHPAVGRENPLSPTWYDEPAPSWQI